MGQISLLYILLFLGTNLFGQPKDLSIPKYKTGELTFWYKWENERIEKLKLPDLKLTSDSIYFRLSTDNQIIDIHSRDGNTFDGQMVIYTTSYDQEQKKKSKYYSSRQTLSADTLRQIIDLFKKLGVNDIPTDSEIEGWRPGTDGKTYIFQFATRDKYSFKTYWTPDSFDSLKEAITINRFVTQIESILTLDKRTQNFFETLPKDNCYRFGSMSIRCIQSGKKRK
jgi:hypothetical protein